MTLEDRLVAFVVSGPGALVTGLLIGVGLTLLMALLNRWLPRFYTAEQVSNLWQSMPLVALVVCLYDVFIKHSSLSMVIADGLAVAGVGIGGYAAWRIWKGRVGSHA